MYEWILFLLCIILFYYIFSILLPKIDAFKTIYGNNKLLDSYDVILKIRKVETLSASSMTVLFKSIVEDVIYLKNEENSIKENDIIYCMYLGKIRKFKKVKENNSLVIKGTRGIQDEEKKWILFEDFYD